LIGTINDDGSGLLNDPTGNRRFVIVPLKRIDFGYQKCNRDQLWAQVMHLYRSGEPWRLTAEEEAAQKLINAEYETESYLEGLLWKVFIADPTAPIMPSVEIMKHLEDAGLKGSQQLNLKELARVMTKAGIEKGRGRARDVGEKRPSGYKGIRPRRVEDEEIPI
jgi:predicted P-loop ATPase